EPYFDEPFYVGFRVGDFELGLDPDTTLSGPGRGGVWAYWEVDDAAGTYDRLLDLGATDVSGVSDVGGGTLVATVEDPFGNLFGIIQLPD
ncbi:MAG: VOC family protein, partial [Rhodothermales bacterium]|nr:VOC family protein [Rhodothermales bacterium]